MTEPTPQGNSLEHEANPELSASFTVASAELPVHGEDTFMYDTGIGVFGVFDGMGGHVGGAEASDTAAREVLDFCIALEDKPLEPVIVSDDPAINVALGDIANALKSADTKIASLNKGLEGKNAMGTTATVAAITVDSLERPVLVVGNVGDSRLYMKRGDRTWQVTEDEGWAHKLTNVLNGSANVNQLDYEYLQPGDRIMICSDGITGDTEDQFLSIDEVNAALSITDGSEAADELIRISRKHDDKSVLVIDFAGIEGQRPTEIPAAGKPNRITERIANSVIMDTLSDSPEAKPVKVQESIELDGQTFVPAEQTPNTKRWRASWRNQDSDVPVTVLGWAGMNKGKNWWWATDDEGNQTAIPDEEIFDAVEVTESADHKSLDAEAKFQQDMTDLIEGSYRKPAPEQDDTKSEQDTNIRPTQPKPPRRKGTQTHEPKRRVTRNGFSGKWEFEPVNRANAQARLNRRLARAQARKNRK